MTKPDGGPAFPYKDPIFLRNTATIDHWILNSGMTLRDWFAGTVSFQMPANFDYINPDDEQDMERIRSLVKLRFIIADAMIKEREK